MSTLSPPAPAAKPSSPAPSRSVRILTTPAGKVMTITETKGKATLKTSYWLQEVEVSFGRRGFRLAKVVRQSGTDKDPAADVYHVLTDVSGDSCDCRGFLRWGKCKHVSGVIAAEKANKL